MGGWAYTPNSSLPTKYGTLPGWEDATSAAWILDGQIRHVHVDIAGLYAAECQREGVRWGLKDAARTFLGVEPVEVDRERMHALSEGELVTYVASDAEVTAELAYRVHEQVVAHAEAEYIRLVNLMARLKQ
jgi:hypothetical protein